MCSSERGQFASLLWEDDRNAEKSHSVSCVGTEACIGSQKSLWWCWAVFLLVLSDSIEETVNLPPYEYSTALEHFTRFFRGNGPWGQSLLDKSRLASCYCSDPIAPTWGLAFISVCLSLKDTLICSVQSRRLGLSCTLPYHTPRGFITLSVWPQGILLHFAFVLCPVLSEQEVWTFSEQSGPEPLYAEEICKMAPRRKSETCARLSVSAVGNNLRLRSVSGPALTSGKHASMHECTQGD